MNNQLTSQFLVFHEEYMGDEASVQETYDAEDAALRYAAHYNSMNSYEMVGRDPIRVKVVGPDQKEYFYEIKAEPDIHYSATRIDKITDEDN